MSTVSRLRKNDTATLRRQLRDLGYGQAEVEEPRLFASRFYPVPEHLRALDPSVVLVVGPRGAGKSELFHAFFRQQDVAKATQAWAPGPGAAKVHIDGGSWRTAYPAGTNFPDSRALGGFIQTATQARDLWYGMLVRCLSDEIPDDKKQPLQGLLEPKAAQIGAILNALATLRDEPTVALDAVEEKLEQQGRRLFLGYDELDTLGGFDWTLMARVVRGLVAFWSDYSRRWPHIRAKIFLRSDLFRRHAAMGTADFAKLAANRAELTWTDAAILGMLVKRLANTSNELLEYCRRARISFETKDELGYVPRIERPEDAHPLLERMVGEFMGAGKKKGYVRNWVLDHLRDGNNQVAPRTVVRLFEQAATKDSANRGVRPPHLLHPTALRQALEDVSNDHVTQGISSEWPWLEGVRTRLLEQRLVPWRRDEVISLLSADWDGSWGSTGINDRIRPPEDESEALLDYLVELGIFRERRDGRIDVPDLYLYGLGLRRKGGVRVGEKARSHGKRRSVTY